MKRRDFMIGAAAATGLVTARRGWAQGRDADKLSRIAIMMFGLNSIVKTQHAAELQRGRSSSWTSESCARIASRFTTSSCRVTTFPRPRCRG